MQQTSAASQLPTPTTIWKAPEEELIAQAVRRAERDAMAKADNSSKKPDSAILQPETSRAISGSQPATPASSASTVMRSLSYTRSLLRTPQNSILGKGVSADDVSQRIEQCWAKRKQPHCGSQRRRSAGCAGGTRARTAAGGRESQQNATSGRAATFACGPPNRFARNDACRRTLLCVPTTASDLRGL